VDRFILVEGPGALQLVRLEEGVQVGHLDDGEVGILQVLPIPVSPQETPLKAAQEHLRRKERWIAALREGDATAADDPFPPTRLIRILRGDQAAIDLRSGLSEIGRLTAGGLSGFVLSRIPIPDELGE
jgi:hypothetical protein